MNTKDLHADDMDGRAMHKISTGTVTFPDGEKVETIMVETVTPLGVIVMHMSPGSAAHMASDLARLALEVAQRESKREHEREMADIASILEALRGFKAGKAH